MDGNAQAPREQHADAATALAFQSAPVLAALATLAVALDLLWRRIALRSWHAQFSRRVVLELERWGDVITNVAALAALIAVGFSIWSFVRREKASPMSGRIGLLMFAGALLPMLAAIIVLPRAWTRPEIVIVVAGLANALMLLCALVGMRLRSTRLIGAALGLMVVAAAFGVAALMTELAGRQFAWSWGGRLATAIQWAGEVAFFLAPVVAGLAAVPKLNQPRGRLAAVVSVATAALVAAGFLVWRFALGHAFPTMLYGAFRVDMLIDHAVWYGVPLAISAALGAATLVSRDRAARQVGLGIFVWLGAGYAPRSPFALLVALLAIILVARASVAIAHRTGDAVT